MVREGRPHAGPLPRPELPPATHKACKSELLYVRRIWPQDESTAGERWEGARERSPEWPVETAAENCDVRSADTGPGFCQGPLGPEAGSPLETQQGAREAGRQRRTGAAGADRGRREPGPWPRRSAHSVACTGSTCSPQVTAVDLRMLCFYSSGNAKPKI